MKTRPPNLISLRAFYKASVEVSLMEFTNSAVLEKYLAEIRD